MKRIAQWCFNILPILIMGIVIWSALSGQHRLAHAFLYSVVVGYGLSFGASHGLELEIIEVKKERCHEQGQSS